MLIKSLPIVAATLLLAGSASAVSISFTNVVTPTNQASAPFTPSSTDLLQTALASVTSQGNFGHDGGQGVGVLTNGVFGTPGGAPVQAQGFAAAGDGSAGDGTSVTFNLDLAARPAGYDIAKILTYAGGDGYRGAQAFTLSYSMVGALDTYLTLAVVNNDFTTGTSGQSGNHNSLVTIEDTAAGVIASGVARLRFVFADTPSTNVITPGGYNNYREFDVVAVPEPGTFALLGLGAAAFGLRRRRSS